MAQNQITGIGNCNLVLGASYEIELIPLNPEDIYSRRKTYMKNMMLVAVPVTNWFLKGMQLLMKLTYNFFFVIEYSNSLYGEISFVRFKVVY